MRPSSRCRTQLAHGASGEEAKMLENPTSFFFVMNRSGWSSLMSPMKRWMLKDPSKANLAGKLLLVTVPHGTTEWILVGLLAIAKGTYFLIWIRAFHVGSFPSWTVSGGLGGVLSSTARVFGSSTTSMLGLSEFGTAIVRLTSPDFASASNCRRRCLTGRAAGPCNATDFERSLGHFSATDVGGNELFVALSRRNLSGCIPRVRSISKLTRNSTHVDDSQGLRPLADQGPYCLGLHS